MPPPPQGRRKDFFPPEKKSSPEANPVSFLLLLAGIRSRILALVLLALVPALILIFQLARAHRDQITRQVNSETLRLARFLASSLDRDVQSARIFLSALAQQDGLPETGALRCPELIRTLDIHAEIYDAVGVADSAGRVLCQAPAALPGARLDSMPWFRAARGSTKFAVGYDPERAMIGKVTMVFGLPVETGEGRMRAMYYSALDLEWMNRLAERLELPEGAAMTVTDKNGLTLVRYPHPELWVGKPYPDSPMSRLVEDREEGVMEAGGVDGVIRLYAFSHVGDGGITVRIGIPTATAYAAANTAMVVSLLALAAVGAVALALAWLAGHYLVARPVRRLVEATRSLAAGNLETRTGMDPRAGELGQLSRAFDEMAESLEWRLAQLRESETERSQSESRFSEIVERAPDAILGVDGDLSLFFCNQGAETMFGRGRGDLEGRGLATLVAREQGADSYEALVGALRDPSRDRVEAMLARNDGTAFRAEVAVARAERHGRFTYTLILRERNG